MIGSDARVIRVLLIYPPVRLGQPARYPPFGMLSLGAVLEAAGVEVEIIDVNALRIPVDEVMRRVRSRRFDVIGIGGMTTVYYYMKLMSLLLKEEYPHIPIIGGGSACSASPHIVLDKTGIDVVCLGEGEDIIVDLVRRLVERTDLSTILGIAYLQDGKIHRTLPRPRIEDVSDLPFPAYHLVDMEHYIRNDLTRYSPERGHLKRIQRLGIDPVKAGRPFHLFSKRGCPFGCNFCYRNFGRKVVYSSVDYTLDHMRFIEEKYNTVHFVFSDEIFNVSKKWVMSFCHRVIDEKRNYLLGTANGLRANVMDAEMLDAMVEAGFGSMGMGIESFYQPTLDAMDKGQKVSDVVRGITLMRERDICINSTQMLFGYETDNRESMDINIKYLKQLGFRGAGFSIPCPYPGTYLYDVVMERGLIPDEEEFLMSLSDRDISDRVINISKLSDDELQRLVDYGDDMMSIHEMSFRHPLLAKVLERLHPIASLRFRVDLLELVRGARRRARWVARWGQPGDADEEGHGLRGDEHLREEVFARLREWTPMRIDALRRRITPVRALPSTADGQTLVVAGSS